ncbi:MAG TPA: TetR/AcrR family transcriptional regulator [Candidatus Dormibacteraeota bacterium]|jgi:AcrR family transcriptional regulator|nr:TetR/AcrR family transcriptional regulator [Candidatus Dormibacteraeota bacterium]
MASTLSRGGERLLQAAEDLFYRQGIVATGVDTLVETAGVSKPTLYAQFGSKEALLAAALDHRRTRRLEGLERHLARVAEPRARLLAVFDWLTAWHGDPASRGCAFLNAAAELPDPGHPARQTVSRYKAQLRGRMSELAAECGVSDPDDLAYELLLLIDGASSRVLVDGDADAYQRAAAAAARLIDSRLETPA